MLESILNRIAERSTALQDLEADLNAANGRLEERDAAIVQLIEDGEFRDNRIAEKDAEIALWTEDSAAMEVRNADLSNQITSVLIRAKLADKGELEANERTIAATQRADAAESQLLQIAEALRIEVETPMAEQAEAPAPEV